MLSNPEERDWSALLDKSLKEVNAHIYSVAGKNPSLAGMGATIVCAIVSANRLYAANIGDSRMYLIDREHTDVRQITKDHSVVGELLESGRITKAEAQNHPQRGRLTRSLGFHPSVEADTFSLDSGTRNGRFDVQRRSHGRSHRCADNGCSSISSGFERSRMRAHRGCK